MKQGFKLILAFLLVSGCGTTNVTTTQTWSPESASDLARVNEAVGGKNARVFLTRGEVFQVEQLFLRPDSSLTIMANTRSQTWSTADIARIDVSRPSKRVLGFVAGAGVGVLLGVLATKNNCSDTMSGSEALDCLGSTFGQVLAIPALGLLGGLIGFGLAPGGSEMVFVAIPLGSSQ